MAAYYRNDTPALRYAAPSTKGLVLGVLFLSLSGILMVFSYFLCNIQSDTTHVIARLAEALRHRLIQFYTVTLIMSVTSFIIALAAHFLMPDTFRICLLVKRGLFDPAYGNPIHFHDGDLLPKVSCKQIGAGIYQLTISVTSCLADDLVKTSTAISSCLNKQKFRRFAVTQTDTDIAYCTVRFRIEDVSIDRSLHIHDVHELKPQNPTELLVQQDLYIDLTTSGSICASGKTRSGKTTSVACLLIQALLSGKDNYGSEIIICDPKRAELSRLPHSYTLDDDGEATQILNALKRYANSILQRQKHLNDLSEKTGDAVHWWDADMHVSFLFLDEYVGLRSIFPKKATKDSDYCLATFDGLLKRIVTTGASAGCYTIISIAQASVEDAGFPSSLRDAMSTRILFRPTLQEGRLLWDSNLLKDFPERVYGPGDAWLSSSGTVDFPMFVHFPYLDFPVYRELGKLLNEYYKDG